MIASSVIPMPEGAVTNSVGRDERCLTDRDRSGRQDSTYPPKWRQSLADTSGDAQHDRQDAVAGMAAVLVPA